ncbi:MAG TPA: hypothetical protein VM286_03365 [Candidatus Thermoplasmatota archaeon]|nr:hypothetical protein [Candidatus Thermoplasmatota archaeon]
MEGAIRHRSAGPVRAPERHAALPSPLTLLNRALAAPIAFLFGILGFAPGQLSIQSFTLTAAALFTMADGTWPHLMAGAAMVYLGLLFDRADLLIAEKRGRPSPWTQFLGVTVDRLIEVALVVALGVLTVRGVTGSPIPPLALLTDGWTLVVCAATAGLWMARKALETHAETLLLRTHLLTMRRLPGPSAIPRHRVAQPVIGRLAGRDESVLAWCLGVALSQLDVTLLLLGSLQLLALIEGVVLFNLRLRDPEVEASRILGPDYL